MSAGARSRAAELLNVPVEATPAKVASLFLFELPRTDFVPPSDSVAALNSLVGLGLPVDSESRPTLREEVEEFAQRYWELIPADRLATWLTLCTRSPDDPTANRLLALQSGLELPGTPFPDTKIEHLASIARELYVLLPRERAIHRNEWLLANGKRHGELIAVASAMKKDHPAFAALDPDLFARLTPQFQVALFAEAATTSPLPERPYSPPKPVVYPALKTPPVKLKAKRTPKRARPLINGDRGILLMVVFMIVLAFQAFKILMGSTTPSTQDPIVMPRMDTEDSNKERKSSKWNIDSPFYLFNEAQVKACKQYEEDLKTKSSAQTPPHWPDWVKAGKPEANVIVPRSKSQP
jgi:hypothetical protein